MVNDKTEKLIRLGKHIKYKRAVKNISAYYIEKKFNIDRGLWSKLENGKLPHLPKPEFLKKIAEILEIDYIFLYVLVGYINNADIARYMSSRNRITEKDRTFPENKP
jgi:transcriptional regulator with XRE-family HTH domain